MTRESARTSSVSPYSTLYRASMSRREGLIIPHRDVWCALSRLWRSALIGVVVLPLAACSISMPLSPFGAGQEPLTTGSIGPISPLADAHDLEDWRRARAALAVALDPQGPGTAVTWDNPDTGNGGAFEAASKAYVRDDRVCRDFAADLSFVEESPRIVSGIACRMSENAWRIDDVVSGEDRDDES